MMETCNSLMSQDQKTINYAAILACKRREGGNVCWKERKKEI